MVVPIFMGGILRVGIRKVGNVTLVDLEGRLCLGEEGPFTQAVTEQLAAGNRVFAFNLTEVPTIDSAGIGAMVRIHSMVARAGGKSRFFGPSKMVLSTLKMVRLNTLLDLCDDEVTALSGL